jgi:hypothetical protein
VHLPPTIEPKSWYSYLKIVHIYRSREYHSPNRFQGKNQVLDSIRVLHGTPLAIPVVPLFLFVAAAADYSYGLSAVDRLTADSFSTVTHVRRQRSFILAALGEAADRCDLILPIGGCSIAGHSLAVQ